MLFVRYDLEIMKVNNTEPHNEIDYNEILLKRTNWNIPAKYIKLYEDSYRLARGGNIGYYERMSKKKLIIITSEK